jgi:sialic acid synthase SpsE
LLIAEIGNNFFGDIKKAKGLIKAANDSGADLIKGQAFKADDIKSGSMSKRFYRACALSVDEYIELIDYARSIGNDMFYSIFSPGFERLSLYQNWHKIAGSQTRAGMISETYDIENMIISVPGNSNLENIKKMKKAEFLYVTDYLTEKPDLDHITILAMWLGRQVGYSDHSIGIDACKRAYTDYGAHIIEKHFCIKKNQKFDGIVFRDTQHGATPREFEQLALHMSS